MTCFVDTSAFLAFLMADDANHAEAKQVFTALMESQTPLATTNYVLLETMALLQHRVGIPAARTFHEDILPLLTIHWVGEAVYFRGVERVFVAGRRKLSLVDCISFEMMKRLGIRTAFTFDSHFKEEGFERTPSRKMSG